MNLKRRTLTGIIWNSIELIGGKVVQLIVVVILARILMPEDFGIIGLLIIFTELSKVILDSGFSQALIRNKSADNLDFTSVFYFNILIGVILYLLLYVSAPFISDFYAFPELTSYSRVVFLIVIINSFGIVQNAKIVKTINFKILANRTIIANLISGALAILLAYNGFGVWALIFQMVTASILRVVLLWFYSSWLPSFEFSLNRIKKLFSFSSNLLISGLIDVIVSNIQTLLIGKFYSKATLGFYTQANQLARIPSQNLTSIVKNVTYPSLSLLQDDSLKLKNSFRTIIRISFFIVFPLMMGLMATSDVLVPMVLGDQWIPSTPYFALICIIGGLMPLYTINQNIYLVKGNSKLFLKVNLVKNLVTLILIIVTIQFSVMALVIGQVVAYAINSLITMYFSGKEIDYNLKEQFRDIKGVFIISILMTLVLYFINYKFQLLQDWELLIFQLGTGILMFLGFSIIFNLSPLSDIKKLPILSKINNFKAIKN